MLSFLKGKRFMQSEEKTEYILYTNLKSEPKKFADWLKEV